MSPIAAVGLTKVATKAASVASDALSSLTYAQSVLPTFDKELAQETGRSEEIAMPVDHELLSLCSTDRQKELGNAIVGHTVQVCDPKGQIISGRVEKVWMDNNQLNFTAAGQNFTVNDLRAVYQPVRPTSLRGITPKDGSVS